MKLDKKKNYTDKSSENQMRLHIRSHGRCSEKGNLKSETESFQLAIQNDYVKAKIDYT